VTSEGKTGVDCTCPGGIGVGITDDVGVHVVDEGTGVGKTVHVGSHVGIHVGRAVDGDEFVDESKTEDEGMGVGETALGGEIGFVGEASGTHEGIHVGRAVVVGEISGLVTKVGCRVAVDPAGFVGVGVAVIPTIGFEVSVGPVESVGLVVTEGPAALFELDGLGVTVDPTTSVGVVEVGLVTTVGVGKSVGFVTAEDVESVESGKPDVVGDKEAAVDVTTEDAHVGIHVDKSVFVGTTVRVGVGIKEGPCEIIGGEELEVSSTAVGETNTGTVDEEGHVGIHVEVTVCEDGEVDVGRIALVGMTCGVSVPTASVGVVDKVGVTTTTVGFGWVIVVGISEVDSIGAVIVGEAV